MKSLQGSKMTSMWLIACLLIAIPAKTDAQSMKMSAKDMTDISTAILYGKCSKKMSHWSTQHDIIYTTVTIVPEEYLKGNMGAEVILTIPGGKVDDILYEVSDMPVFEEGEEVFAFVWKHPSGKYLVTGGDQGKLKIMKDKKTGKRTVKAKKSKSEEEDLTPGEMPLDEFVGKVKGYMK